MSKSIEVIIVPEDGFTPDRQNEGREDGVEIPFERINSDTLHNLIAEFVTRESEESGGSHHTVDQKISQVIEQLKDNRARVVFDLISETCNIVSSDRRK